MESDSTEAQPLTAEDTVRALNTAIKRVMGKFYNYVEKDDIVQEAMLTQLEHPAKFQKWVDEGKYLSYHNELHRVMAAYAQRQRAQALGYRPEDLFFYSKKTLREVIPAVLVWWETEDRFEDVYRDRALWLDVIDALKALSVSDQQIVYWAFRGDDDVAVGAPLVAERLGIDPNAARSRIDRILRKLQETLGGADVFYSPKHSRSNAAALAEIHGDYDND